MIILQIKPLSVNKCFAKARNSSRLFPTSDYKQYVKDLHMLLPATFLIPDCEKFEIKYVYGLSNSLADYDNPTKPTQDIIAKFYGFDDRKIHKGTIYKVKVPKGKEFIGFDIFEFNGVFDSEVEEYLQKNNIISNMKLPL